jgi:hypothetical protein
MDHLPYCTIVKSVLFLLLRLYEFRHFQHGSNPDLFFTGL